jgi:hypothetical protein
LLKEEAILKMDIVGKGGRSQSVTVISSNGKIIVRAVVWVLEVGRRHHNGNGSGAMFIVERRKTRCAD